MKLKEKTVALKIDIFLIEIFIFRAFNAYLFFLLFKCNNKNSKNINSFKLNFKSYTLIIN